MKKKQKTTSNTNYNQTQKTNQDTRQSSTTDAKKSVQKLNFFGPNYDMVWNNSKQGYEAVMNNTLQNLQRAKQSKALQLMQTMPSYQDVGLGNSLVQNILGSLNDQTNLQFKDLLNATDNRTAANREYGSSFEATRQGKLTSEYAKQRASNILSALASGSDLQGKNIANRIGLGSYLTSNVAPVFDPNTFMRNYADVATKGNTLSIGNLSGLTNTAGVQNQNSTTVQSGGLGQLLGSMIGL